MVSLTETEGLTVSESKSQMAKCSLEQSVFENLHECLQWQTHTTHDDGELNISGLAGVYNMYKSTASTKLY